MTDMDNVLVINAGSSSVKFQLFGIPAHDRLELLVKGVPVFWLPYASVSIKQRDRASGFLTPTFSGSGEKGMRFSNAYYQTLGRSADITFRNDIRRCVIFGRNDLMQDAPISRVDLLVSRNTLMYFNAPAQQRILSNFYFALAPGGYLVVGASERVADPRSLDLTFSRPSFLEVFLEIAPGLFVTPYVAFDVEGYVGVRFYF